MTFPFRTYPFRLTVHAVSTKQNWKRVCIVLCHETVVRSNNGSRSFSFLHSSIRCCPPVPRPSTLAAHLSRLVGLLGFILALGTSLFPISASSRGASMVQCHHQVAPDLCSEFSMDLHARYYAILVSWLLRIVHNIGLCGLHFFAQIEVEDVLFDADWNELYSLIFRNVSSFPGQFSCALESLNHRPIPNRNNDVLGTRFLQHCTTRCELHQRVFRSEIDTNRFHRNLESAKIHTDKNTLTTGCSIKTSCSFWTEVQWKCVHCRSCAQVHFHPIKPLRTAHCTKSKTSQ